MLSLSHHMEGEARLPVRPWHCHLLLTTATLAPLQLQPAGQQITVVGDTHGQYHDVCQL